MISFTSLVVGLIFPVRPEPLKMIDKFIIS